MRQITSKIIDAKAVTTVSDPISLEGVVRATLQFIRADHTSGSGAFSVEVSNDGANWVTFNKLIDNLANTNAQTNTRVASSTLASNTSKIYTLDLLQECYKWMRVTVTRTTDGTHSVIGALQYEE